MPLQYLSDGQLVQHCAFAPVYRGAGNGDFHNVNCVDGALEFAPSKPVLSRAGYPFVPAKYQGAFDDGHGHIFYFMGGVPRLNDGLKHLSFNPNGSAKAKDNKFWHDSAQSFTSKADCFNPAKLLAGSGTIVSGNKGAEFNGYYDAIHNSGWGGVIDFRFYAIESGDKEKAAQITARVENGTYRGMQKLDHSFVLPKDENVWHNSSDGSIDIAVNGKGPFVKGHLALGSIVSIVGSNFLYIGVVTSISNSTLLTRKSFTGVIPQGTITGRLIVTTVEDSKYYANGSFVKDYVAPNISVSGAFTQENVMGNPINILANWDLANGWLGGWINNIPGGGASDFLLTRKRLSSGNVKLYYSNSNGENWGVTEAAFNTVTNSYKWVGVATNMVAIGPYTAFAKQTKLSTNKPVFNAEQGMGNVFSTSTPNIPFGVLLHESLTSKIGTNSSGANPFSDKIQSFTLNSSDEISVSTTYAPIHSALRLGAPNNNSPAVKALPYQISNNGQCSLGYQANELKWRAGSDVPRGISSSSRGYTAGELVLVQDSGSRCHNRVFLMTISQNSAFGWNMVYVDAEGFPTGIDGTQYKHFARLWNKSNQWGDDSTIKIANGSQTFIDLNGDTCLAVSHELSIPYGYTRQQ